jgi:hypothetical protein
MGFPRVLVHGHREGTQIHSLGKVFSASNGWMGIWREPVELNFLYQQTYSLSEESFGAGSVAMG